MQDKTIPKEIVTFIHEAEKDVNEFRLSLLQLIKQQDYVVVKKSGNTRDNCLTENHIENLTAYDLVVLKCAMQNVGELEKPKIEELLSGVIYRLRKLNFFRNIADFLIFWECISDSPTLERIDTFLRNLHLARESMLYGYWGDLQGKRDELIKKFSNSTYEDSVKIIASDYKGNLNRILKDYGLGDSDINHHILSHTLIRGIDNWKEPSDKTISDVRNAYPALRPASTINKDLAQVDHKPAEQNSYPAPVHIPQNILSEFARSAITTAQQYTVSAKQHLLKQEYSAMIAAYLKAHNIFLVEKETLQGEPLRLLENEIKRLACYQIWKDSAKDIATKTIDLAACQSVGKPEVKLEGSERHKLIDRLTERLLNKLPEFLSIGEDPTLFIENFALQIKPLFQQSLFDGLFRPDVVEIHSELYKDDMLVKAFSVLKRIKPFIDPYSTEQQPLAALTARSLTNVLQSDQSGAASSSAVPNLS